MKYRLRLKQCSASQVGMNAINRGTHYREVGLDLHRITDNYHFVPDFCDFNISQLWRSRRAVDVKVVSTQIRCIYLRAKNLGRIFPQNLYLKKSFLFSKIIVIAIFIRKNKTHTFLQCNI